jgi:hypothetical protein
MQAAAFIRRRQCDLFAIDSTYRFAQSAHSTAPLGGEGEISECADANF